VVLAPALKVEFHSTDDGLALPARVTLTDGRGRRLEARFDFTD
jgi:hypothetical protein